MHEFIFSLSVSAEPETIFRSDIKGVLTVHAVLRASRLPSGSYGQYACGIATTAYACCQRTCRPAMSMFHAFRNADDKKAPSG